MRWWSNKAHVFPDGRTEKTNTVPWGIGTNWKQGGNPTRVISGDPRGLGAKLNCYTPRKKFYTKKIIWDWLKRNWVQWWHFEKLSVKIGSYEIFITFLRTETKALYFIVKRSWSLQNSFFTATLEKRRPRDIEKAHKNSLLAQHLNLHQLGQRNKNIFFTNCRSRFFKNR